MTLLLALLAPADAMDLLMPSSDYPAGAHDRVMVTQPLGGQVDTASDLTLLGVGMTEVPLTADIAPVTSG